MDALWPDRDPASAANNLNQAVHAARRALGRRRSPCSTGCSASKRSSTRSCSSAPPATRGASERARPATRALPLGGELLPENRYDDWAERRARTARRPARGARADARQTSASRPAGVGCRSTDHFVGRDHELGRAAGAARAYPPAHARRHRRRRQDTARARARAAAARTRTANGAALVELDSVAEGAASPRRRRGGTRSARASGRSPGRRHRAELAPRELLLVLDNCEHLIGAQRLPRRTPCSARRRV